MLALSFALHNIYMFFISLFLFFKMMCVLYIKNNQNNNMLCEIGEMYCCRWMYRVVFMFILPIQFIIIICCCCFFVLSFVFFWIILYFAMCVWAKNAWDDDDAMLPCKRQQTREKDRHIVVRYHCLCTLFFFLAIFACGFILCFCFLPSLTSDLFRWKEITCVCAARTAYKNCIWMRRVLFAEFVISFAHLIRFLSVSFAVWVFDVQKHQFFIFISLFFLLKKSGWAGNKNTQMLCTLWLCKRNGKSGLVATQTDTYSGVLFLLLLILFSRSTQRAGANERIWKFFHNFIDSKPIPGLFVCCCC